MKHQFLFPLVFSSTLCCIAQTSTPESQAAPEPVTLTRVVVSAGPDTKPLEVVLDTKAPAQPIPAQDGADFLKAIPGFSVIRKGGIDGDPILRGQAGSRLNILLDGQNILGGCGNRMDPPTAYVFPSSYDRVVVLKGPQTVLYGPGSTAGVVLFERKNRAQAAEAAALEASVTLGSHGRRDASAEASGASSVFFGRINATQSEAEDYTEGAGLKVHSNYERWSTSATLGWTPVKSTVAEFSASRSNGQAAYADRTMDGTKFLRDNLGFHYKQELLSPLVTLLECSAYYNYVDHVMDNYSLRTAPSTRMLSNPDRRTTGGRTTLGLRFTEQLGANVGADFQNNTHSKRTDLGAGRVRDAELGDLGFFGELSYALSEASKLIGGMRLDAWSGRDKRNMITLGTGMQASSVANPTANKKRESQLGSGFLRYERTLLGKTLTGYAGLGTVARFPDYWELLNKESESSISSFDIKSERCTQIDTGLLYRKGSFSASAALFANRTKDHILVVNNYLKPSGSSGVRTTTLVRNIEASALGAELATSYTVNKTWTLDASLAYVRGENRTDAIPLAQQPPLEGKLGVSYTGKTWFLGAISRLVAEQTRFALNQGNIAGQDLGRAAGFGLFSLNAGWRPNQWVQVSTGIDNLFDKTYAEFVSRAGTDLSGYTKTTRVNEPGRSIWVKVDLSY